MANRDEALSRVLRTARHFQADFTADQLSLEYKKKYDKDVPLKELGTTARTVDAWLREEGAIVKIKHNEEGKYRVEEIRAQDGKTVRSHLVDCVRDKKDSVHSLVAVFARTLKKRLSEFGFKTTRALFLSFPELTTNSHGRFQIDSQFVGTGGEGRSDKFQISPAEQAKRTKSARTVAPKIEHKREKAVTCVLTRALTRVPQRRLSARTATRNLGEEAAKKNKTAVPAKGRSAGQARQNRDATEPQRGKRAAVADVVQEEAPKRQRMDKEAVAESHPDAEENQGDAVALGRGGVENGQGEAVEPEQQMKEPAVVDPEEKDAPEREIKQEEPGVPPANAYGGFHHQQTPFGYSEYGLPRQGYPVVFAPLPQSRYEHFGRHVVSLLDEADTKGENVVAITHRILDAFNEGRNERQMAPVPQE